jgi:diguanylate cyclase (GGDEF)-like protein/PAS domain S-box-containing protein
MIRIKIPALRIAIIYLLFGVLWIFVSDSLLAELIPDPATLTRYQTYKGWLYVLATALLAYLLVSQALRRQTAAESSLRASESRFHAIFDNVNDIILLHDAGSGKIIEANNKAVEMLGYSRAELYRLSVAQLSSGIPPYTQQNIAANLARARQGETPVFEWQAKRRDGSLFWVEISLRQAGIAGRSCVLALARDITGRRQAETALRESEQRLHAFFDNAKCLVWIKDMDGRFLMVNRYMETMFGLTGDRFLGRTLAEISPEQEAEAFADNDRKVLYSGAPLTFDETLRFKDGLRTYFSVKFPLRDAGGRIYALGAICTDITEHRRAENAISESERRYRLLFDNMLEGFAYCQMLYENGQPQDFIYIDVNAAFERLTGLKDVIGKKASEAIPGIHESNPELFEIYGRVASSGKPERFETYVEPLATWFSLSVYGAGSGHFVAMFDNITERKAAEAKIDFLAYHDQLTGLPNLLLARDRFKQASAHAARNKNKVALMYLDLDHFKTINDSIGHAVGDALLKVVAILLQQCVRNADAVSRQSGDEFLIMLTDVHDTQSVTSLSARMLEQLALPLNIEGHELSTSASIGATVFPDDGEDFDTLLKKAETAMYHAKEAGRNACHFFDQHMNVEANEAHAMRNGLRLALERGEFVVHYQPQVNLASGALIGAEALIRWNHPELGLLPPDRFIQIAEDNGLIVPIGAWVLREACRQAVAWQKSGMDGLVMAVNLSAVQFKHGDLEQTILSALTESGLEPPFLELELTESILIRDTENVLNTVQHLKSLGIRLSIDDFGTGYSSLSYLSRFAVDKVKIDQSFVRGLAASAGDAAIVRAIIQMARSLGLRTIAEGVEEKHLYDYLRAHHCDEAQGYYIGRPMPADEFAAYAASHFPDSSHSR